MHVPNVNTALGSEREIRETEPDNPLLGDESPHRKHMVIQSGSQIDTGRTYNYPTNP